MWKVIIEHSFKKQKQTKKTLRYWDKYPVKLSGEQWRCMEKFKTQRDGFSELQITSTFTPLQSWVQSIFKSQMQGTVSCIHWIDIFKQGVCQFSDKHSLWHERILETGTVLNHIWAQWKSTYSHFLMPGLFPTGGNIFECFMCLSYHILTLWKNMRKGSCSFGVLWDRVPANSSIH